MKFLPDDKKKTIRSLLALAVAVGGIVYFNFFAGANPQALPPRDTIALPQAGMPPVAPVAPASPSGGTAMRSQGGLLPYGGKIDLGILDNPKFKILKSVLPLQVLPEELGRSNLFGD